MTTLNELNSEPELLSTPDTSDIPSEENSTSHSSKQSQTEVHGADSDNTTDVNAQSTGPADSKPFTIVKGSKRYVISIDNKPKFYVNTIEEVPTKVEEIMEYLTEIHPDYDMFKNQVEPNVWTITRRYKWFVMSYEEVLRTISCNVIRQIEFTPRDEVVEDEEVEEPKEDSN